MSSQFYMMYSGLLSVLTRTMIVYMIVIISVS